MLFLSFVKAKSGVRQTCAVANWLSPILLTLGHLQASLDGSRLLAAFFTLHSSLFT